MIQEPDTISTAPAEQDTASYEATRAIAEQLKERNPSALHQIRRLVQLIGLDQTQAYVQEALAVEASGGMMVSNGSRRRTPGGTFLFLVRGKVAPDVRDTLWPPPTRESRARDRARKAAWKRAHPQIAPAAAGKRQPIAPSTKTDSSQKKKVEVGTTVKITLIGRPASKIADKGPYVALVLQQSKVPALPKGMPDPETGPTNYVVFVSSKQWKPVAQAIEDPEDALIIEGFPQVNVANGSIKVWATNVTTRNLQQQKRSKSA